MPCSACACSRGIAASPRSVATLVLQEHGGPIGVGLACGLGPGGLGGTALGAFLTDVGPADPLAMLAAVAVVAGAGVSACAMPTLRATRVDPIAAIREP